MIWPGELFTKDGVVEGNEAGPDGFETGCVLMASLGVHFGSFQNVFCQSWYVWYGQKYGQFICLVFFCDFFYLAPDECSIGGCAHVRVNTSSFDVLLIPFGIGTIRRVSPNRQNLGTTQWRLLHRSILAAILLMAEILHQLMGSLSHYLQDFIHPRWLAGFLPSTVPVL